MSSHGTIVITPHPRGRFIEGIISGTPKPGTIMQIASATEPVGGKYTFEVYNRDATGNRPKGPLWVLCEDINQGKTVSDAYVSGTQGRLYAPLPGDEVQVLFDDPTGTGTGSDVAIGDIFVVVDGSGLVDHTTGLSPESEPFMAAETQADLTADTLIHCFFTGY